MKKGFSVALFLIILILFSLPWITISCEGTTVGKATGFQLASQNATIYGAGVQKVDSGPWILFSLLATIGGIVFVFLNDKRYHNLSIFLAGLISLILLIFRFIAPFYAQRVANRGVSSELDYFKNTLSESVKIHFEAGFYITLIFAIILTFLNWRWSHSESISILEKRYIASEPVKKSIAGDYIFCSECGTRNHKNNSFCSNCGKKLS